MKLSVLQENLQKAVSTANRFTSTKAQLPIIGNILFKATKAKLMISSTNLESSVTTEIGAKVEEEGEIAIPSKIVSEIVGNLNKGNVDLELDKEQLKISSNSFKSNILGMNSVDFPKIPTKIDSKNSSTLKIEDFANALSRVLFAVSIDETRPVLTGVLFKIEDNDLSVVATDGFRLSLTKIKSQKLNTKSFFILPKNILQEILRVDSDSETFEIEIQEKEKQAVFGFGGTVYSSRLIEGEFPEYNKIIPKETFVKVDVDKEDFAKGIKLAGVFARDNSNIVKLQVKKNEIVLSAQSSNSGNQETKVEAKIENTGENKDNFEISFNYKFIEDFIGSVKGESVKIEFTTTDKAGVFFDPGDSNYLHLIMPVRVQT